jgi:hypothetical protein
MKTPRIAGACALLLIALSLSSCDLIEKLLGGSTDSISVTMTGPATLHWYETGTWTATVDSSAAVSYQWFVDGVAQSGTSNTLTLQAVSATASTHSISVTATAGSSTDTDSMSLNTLARPFDVNLTGPTSLKWGEDGAYYSGLTSATDNDGNTLTFTWYLDDVPQTNLSPTSYSIIFTPQPNVNTTSSTDLRLTVNNRYGSLSSAVTTVSIGAPAFVQINNQSGLSIYYWYFKLSNSTGWSDDILGTTILYNGSTSSYYRFMPGTYDFDVSDSTDTVIASDRNRTITAGSYLTLTAFPPAALSLSGGTEKDASPVQASRGFSMRAAQ